MGVLGVDQKKALFDSTGKDVANKIKTMTDAYSKMDKNAPEALATKQEIDSLNQRHLAYTTESRKYQREIDEELRKQAEEKRKEEIHPLEQKKLTAEIGKLNALAAQARARGSAEGGLTPAQRLSDQRAQINSIQAQADDARAIIVAQLKEETDPQMRKMLNDGLGKIPGHVRAATEAIRRGNDYTGLQEFNTWLANPRGYRAAAPAKVPVAQGSGSSGLVKKYNSPEEVMAALKNTDASTAVQILRANNMTVDDLRKTGQPKTPSPKTQEAAKQKRPHEMTPEELKKADVEYWNKWKTAAGRVSPIAPKSPSEQAAEFNKAVEYNRQLAERAKKRNLFGQR